MFDYTNARLEESKAMQNLKTKLKCRFLILDAFVQKGPTWSKEWAAKALDPDIPESWYPETYMACYNNPEA